jgi:hypothetical protein
VSVEHDVAGAEVVGKVDRGEWRQRDHEEGDEDPGRNPDVREPDPGEA